MLHWPDEQRLTIPLNLASLHLAAVALAPRSELLALLAMQVLGICEVGASLRDRLLVGGAYGHLMCGRWRILRQSGTGSDCERKNNCRNDS
jgi:hypothetical protein